MEQAAGFGDCSCSKRSGGLSKFKAQQTSFISNSERTLSRAHYTIREEGQRQTEGLTERTVALAHHALLFFKVTRKKLLILDEELGLGCAPGCGR